MLIEKLTRIGLSVNEAKIYCTLLQFGQATASKISKKSKSNRVSTYYVLEQLEKKGLVSQINRNNKKYFIAEPPRELMEYIKRF